MLKTEFNARMSSTDVRNVNEDKRLISQEDVEALASLSAEMLQVWNYDKD